MQQDAMAVGAVVEEPLADARAASTSIRYGRL